MDLIDTHFHLDFYRDHKYWYDYINQNRQYTLCVTNSPGVYHSCKRLYPETKYLKFALGFNPKSIVFEKFDKRLLTIYKVRQNILAKLDWILQGN